MGRSTSALAVIAALSLAGCTISNNSHYVSPAEFQARSDTYVSYMQEQKIKDTQTKPESVLWPDPSEPSIGDLNYGPVYLLDSSSFSKGADLEFQAMFNDSSIYDIALAGEISP